MSIECPCPAGLRGECCYNAALDDVLAIRPIASLRVRDAVKALRKEVSP